MVSVFELDSCTGEWPGLLAMAPSCPGRGLQRTLDQAVLYCKSARPARRRGNRCQGIVRWSRWPIPPAEGAPAGLIDSRAGPTSRQQSSSRYCARRWGRLWGRPKSASQLAQPAAVRHASATPTRLRGKRQVAGCNDAALCTAASKHQTACGEDSWTIRSRSRVCTGLSPGVWQQVAKVSRARACCRFGQDVSDIGPRVDAVAFR
jgi:hypothetical protein